MLTIFANTLHHSFMNGLYIRRKFVLSRSPSFLQPSWIRLLDAPTDQGNAVENTSENSSKENLQLKNEH